MDSLEPTFGTEIALSGNAANIAIGQYSNPGLVQVYNFEAGTNTWNPHPDRVEQEDIFDVCLSNDAMKVGYCTI